MGIRKFAILPGTETRVLPVSLFYGIATFTAVITLLEFWRGMRARHRSTGESYPGALWTLFGRNRRRYGGYLIHIGVIMIALGVIGTQFFQVETQRNLAVGESLTITSPLTGEYSLTYKGLESLPAPDDTVAPEPAPDDAAAAPPTAEAAPEPMAPDFDVGRCELLGFENPVALSAATGAGCDRLLELLDEIRRQHYDLASKLGLDGPGLHRVHLGLRCGRLRPGLVHQSLRQGPGGLFRLWMAAAGVIVKVASGAQSTPICSRARRI